LNQHGFIVWQGRHWDYFFALGCNRRNNRFATLLHPLNDLHHHRRQWRGNHPYHK
jgi:hypothetical protein